MRYLKVPDLVITDLMIRFGDLFRQATFKALKTPSTSNINKNTFLNGNFECSVIQPPFDLIYFETAPHDKKRIGYKNLGGNSINFHW